MVSHVADVMRRGIWASLTGGWFYDTSTDLVCNVIHLYIWSSLLIAPFLLHMLFKSSWEVWSLYCAALVVVFIVIKFGNHFMHGFFDTHQSEGGGRTGLESSKDNSSHGSLESLSEHLAAFCTDPDVAENWRRLHPRRRQSARTQNPTSEEIPLRSMEATQSSSTTVDLNGMPSSSKQTSTQILPALSPSDWDLDSSSLRPETSVPERNGSITEALDGAETINFRADIHIQSPEKLQSSNSAENAREGDSLLELDAVGRTPLPPKVRVNLSADQGQPSGALDSDKPSSSGMARLSSADPIQHAGDRHLVKRSKSRPHRQNTVNDTSVTSVVNQPTHSMELLLSTFKPAQRQASTESGSGVQPVPGAIARESSPKGLRRAKSEFYTPSGHSGRGQSSKMVSDPSLSVPLIVQPPTEPGSMGNNGDSNSSDLQTHSTPNLGQDDQKEGRKVSVNSVSPSAPPDDGRNVVDTRPAPKASSSVVVDEGEYVPEHALAVARRGHGLRRTPAFIERATRGHHLDPLLPQRSPPPGFMHVTAAGRDQLLREMAEREYTESRAFRPEPQLEPGHPEESDLFLNALRNQRPIRASSLLRRERENRALMRADSPDPRARLESMTNSRGLLETVTSWFTGPHPANPALSEETFGGRSGSWNVPPVPGDRPSTSRTTSHVGSHNEEELPGNRYSPQTSIVSSDRADYDPHGMPSVSGLMHGLSRLNRVDSGSNSSGRRMRFTVLTNPLWQGDDTIQESGALGERAENPTGLDERRSTWQLMPDSASSAMTAEQRAAIAAHLMRSCYSDDKSSNSLEYHLGPKSWKELFGEERSGRNARVRFQPPMYKLSVFPWRKDSKQVSVHLDRLTLQALFDRTRSVWDCIWAVLMCAAVGAAGACLLGRFYHDIWAFLLCFVMAGCQYSLIKSVQPDSNSPTHGFNRIAVYTRAAYFCVATGMILLLDHLSTLKLQPPVLLFGFTAFTPALFSLVRDLFIYGLLGFPLIFAYGLLPQINTFPMYVFEQFEIHVFGGTATCSLISSVYVLVRNCIAVGALHVICYSALPEVDAARAKEPNLHLLRGSQPLALFSGLLIGVTYFLSRCSSDPGVLWNVLRRIFKRGDCQSWAPEGESRVSLEVDLVQERIEMTVYDRLRSDVLLGPIFVMVYFGLQGSTLFSLNTMLTDVLITVAVALGFILSYVVPKLRAQMPWLCFSKPLLQSYKHTRTLRCERPPEVTIFESIYLWLRIIERNILYPCILLGILSNQSIPVSAKYGPYVASVLITFSGLKFLRLVFSDAENQYLILAFASLFFRFDAAERSETFLLNYFVVSFFYYKLREWTLKWKFVMTYVAPWQITWGSAFHAFAQPFSIPHSGMLLIQTVISTLMSSPLNPFLGSAIFLTSYPRPVKFWEKTYKTRRLDHSNTRLDAQLDGHSGNDDNNLNSIFYEHLTHSLQKSLCGDIIMGKWGNVSSGDFFILASDYLNCLVHIIEIGNGMVTFQVRGLEFRGTYCQQREVEAITENVDENRGFCCCEPGHLPHMLSLNSAFNQRWLAWQVYAGRYVVQGYSVSDNNASTMFQIYDLRRILVTFYIKTIVYYLVKQPKLLQWLSLVEKEIRSVHVVGYHDFDPLFVPNIDIDFAFGADGISRHCFFQVLHPWIEHCVNGSEFKGLDITEMSPFITLAFALSVCGRRVLGAAAQLSLHSVDWFLHGLHALFKGDFRINCPRDEWVFTDMDLLHKVIAPAIRMALKLHQDHFTAPDEYERNEALYIAIVEHEASMVICHEGDPKWRQAVLANTPSLLALRHVVDDNRDDYKIIMLNIRNLDFRLIKINKECVRGFWAGQLQELVYFRNRNPERGSIQNAKQALRNMINSSCDQPIGYPIYVSPLTTSYADTHSNLCKVVGGPLTFEAIRDCAKSVWEDVRDRCYASCSGSSGEPRVVRPREPPVVVTYNPQGQRPVEFLRRANT